MKVAKTHNIVCRGQSLLLDHRRCVYWPARQTLLLADVHLGKEAVFQRRGMAIPNGIAENSVEQIKQLLIEYKPDQLLILGDLVHALPHTQENWINNLDKLLKKFPATTFTVVSGNHDKPGTAMRLPDGIQWSGTLDVAPFHFRHEPIEASSEAQRHYTLCGHLHPCFTLATRKGAAMRMPVFWIGQHQMILPAFGEFTGMQRIQPDPGDRYFGIGPDGIVELSQSHPTSACFT